MIFWGGSANPLNLQEPKATDERTWTYGRRYLEDVKDDSKELLAVEAKVPGTLFEQGLGGEHQVEEDDEEEHGKHKAVAQHRIVAQRCCLVRVVEKVHLLGERAAVSVFANEISCWETRR
eukprot:3164562-Rhodomonas_salina.2